MNVAVKMNSFPYKRRAKLPYNKKGRIGPYTKDGGNKAKEKGGSEHGMARFSRRQPAPTMDQIQSDRLTKYAREYWSPQTAKTHSDYSADVIEDIYKVDLTTKQGSNVRRVMMLEFSQYMENYLWPNFTPDATIGHVMSIVYMVNEKFRERVPAWVPFQKKPDQFPEFFRKVMKFSLMSNDAEAISLKEQTALLVFLGHCFTSMEVDLVRVQIQKLVSLSMWESLLDRRRDQELECIPRWRKFWKAIKKKDAKETDEVVKAQNTEDRWFMRRLMDKFVHVLGTIQEKEASMETVDYCEHFLLFMIDLEALLPTRRFFNTVLDDSQLITKCTLSALNKREEGKLFSQLLDMLKFYARFEISDETGDPLDDKQMMQIHYDRITSLQLAVFAKYPEMRKFALGTVASIDDRENLAKHFKDLKKETLYAIAEFLYLVPEQSTVNLDDYDREFLVELLIARHEKRDSQLQELNEMPLYPTEDVIWDENIVPGEYYNGEGVLALPKLNLQFLTLHDYLLRNFKLFQLESTYEIRGDVEDAVSRLKPWTADDGQVVFGGWARMALPITTFAIGEVAKPNIGEKQPARVRADVSVNLSVKDAIKTEWENLKRHDVCFLITVRPPMAATATNFNYMEDFVPQVKELLLAEICSIIRVLRLRRNTHVVFQWR